MVQKRIVVQAKVALQEIKTRHQMRCKKRSDAKQENARKQKILTNQYNGTTEVLQTCRGAL